MTVKGVLWGHGGTFPNRATDGLENVGAFDRVGFWTVDVNAGNRIDFDPTEERGKEELVTVDVV